LQQSLLVQLCEVNRGPQRFNGGYACRWLHTLLVTDADVGGGQVVWFEFTTPQGPWQVDRE